MIGSSTVMVEVAGLEPAFTIPEFLTVLSFTSSVTV